jgi:hypothetical protein
MAGDEAEPDVVWDLAESERKVGEAWPPGPPVASATTSGTRWYAASRSATGYHFRFHGLADFHISDDGRRVEARHDRGCSPEQVVLLFSGTVMSFLLALRGLLVLHGSAVVLDDGSALAFIGRSGTGKSTLAALCCAVGAPLVTDDVLPLDLGRQGPAPVSILGSVRELRLREQARTIAELFECRPPTRSTVDGRLALAPPSVTASTSRLHAIVAPRLHRDRDSPMLDRLQPVDALVQILSCPRILVWHDPSLLDEQFQQAARLAETVPVYRAEIPWGRPFDRALGSKLIAELGVAG